MLTTLIIISFVCWIAGFIPNGICLYNFMLLIPTIMFSVRKVGIHIKQSNIFITEGLFLFFSFMWRMLFDKFGLLSFIFGILIRLVFIIVVIYDDATYVYVSEERKKI